LRTVSQRFFLGEGLMKRRLLVATFACGLISAASAQAGPNLIANGSFETPTVPTSGFTDFPVGGSTLTNWNVVGPAGLNVSIVSGTFAQNGVTFEAEDGVQWLDLTGDGSNSTEGVSQTATTIANHQYALSYFIGNTTGGGIFGTTSTVNVLLNGTQTFSHTNSNADTTGLNWEQFTDDFVASGTSTLIEFQNGDPSGDNSNGLDNILLSDLGPAPTVPEPASLSIFAAGLVAFGVWRRRKSG
jgi:hypothetical protein